MLSSLVPYCDLIEAGRRIAKVYDNRIGRIDLSSKRGFLREIDEYQGVGEIQGIIDRVIKLFELQLISVNEINVVIEKWEKLWYGVLGYKPIESKK